jgi:Protein of unknown function (DUF2865)
MIRDCVRRFGPAFLVAAAAMVAGGQAPPPPMAPAPPNANPICVRLEGALANIDRGGGDQSRAEQLRRYEEAAQRQQQDIDRLTAQGERMGCTRSTFFLFGGGQPPQCDRINNQIQNMRANLDRINAGLQQLQGNNADAQRQQVLAQLAQNNCGPQYRAAAPAGNGGNGLFDTLFGNNNNNNNPNPGDPNAAPAGTFRTVCVRTCDGFFFPVSYATVPSKFADDEKTCQRTCPASEAALYIYRNPGEDMGQAVSTSGRRYSELPTAFRFRQAFDPACSCKLAGQSWADALKNINEPVERGDIVVTEERAKLLSQPPDATKGTKQNTKNTKTAPKPPGAAANTAPPPPADTPPPAAEAPPPPDGKRTVRVVGPPQMVPGR